MLFLMQRLEHNLPDACVDFGNIRGKRSLGHFVFECALGVKNKPEWHIEWLRE